MVLGLRSAGPVMADPVPGDVDAPRDPDVVVRRDVVEEAGERRRAARDGPTRRQWRPTDSIFGAVSPSA